MAKINELEQDCIARPHDSRPREALAAALEAINSRRGEFVRLQLESYAHRQKHHQEPPREHLRQEDELARAAGHLWAKGLVNFVRVYNFRRGMVEMIEVDPDQFRAKHGNMFRLAPIRHIRFVEAAGVVDELLALGKPEQLIALDFSGSAIGDDGARAIARCSQLSGLRWLRLRGCQITEAGVEALAAADTLRNVGFLDLEDNPTESPFRRLVGMDFDGSYQDEEKTRFHVELTKKYPKQSWITAVWDSPPHPDAV